MLLRKPIAVMPVDEAIVHILMLYRRTLLINILRQGDEWGKKLVCCEGGNVASKPRFLITNLLLIGWRG